MIPDPRRFGFSQRRALSSTTSVFAPITPVVLTNARNVCFFNLSPQYWISVVKRFVKRWYQDLKTTERLPSEPLSTHTRRARIPILPS
jgi:hypothetical protein